MKCPVCKTECSDNVCLECGFDDLNPQFISKEDANEWTKTIVEPYREKYWKTLTDFEIEGKTLTRYIGNKIDVVIPFGIEVIGENAFWDKKIIRKVFLPDTIKIIGFSAFYDSDLEFINLPISLEKIEILAFGHTKLKHIDIPGSCKVVEDEAFTFCNLKSVIISEGVTVLGDFVFHCCIDLEYIVIPSTLEKIGRGSLATQATHTEILIPPNNKRYRFTNDCLCDIKTGRLIAGFTNDEGCINIPDYSKISIIGAYAFAGIDTDCVIEIPNNIKEIEDSAFGNCGKIEIIIPISVEKIGKHIFDSTEASIFCESKYKPIGWNECWLNEFYPHLYRCSKTVYWQNDWDGDHDMPMAYHFEAIDDDDNDELPF